MQSWCQEVIRGFLRTFGEYVEQATVNGSEPGSGTEGHNIARFHPTASSSIQLIEVQARQADPNRTPSEAAQSNLKCSYIFLRKCKVSEVAPKVSTEESEVAESEAWSSMVL